MHFQVPPFQQEKVVLCLRGRAWDVALDLRIGSPTYLEHTVVNLDSAAVNAMYLPAGVAHGFCVTDDAALLYYKASSVYSPLHDQGVRWDSAGISWPVDHPIISERDRELPGLDEFVSPFKLNARLAGE
jgi:dTDP-4-dehydrorhamnose 3,5-epimerase